MKLSRHNQSSTDPSSAIGNVKRNTTRVVAAAAAALALAACTSSHSSAEKATVSPSVSIVVPTPEVTTPATPAEQSPEENKLVKAKAQKTAVALAGRVISEYNKHGSKHNFLYEPKPTSGQPEDFHAVNVLYNTKTLLAGAYGEYGLLATVRRNKAGQLDPGTVDSVTVLENVNVAGKSRATNPGDRVNLYDFTMDKNKTTGDWNVRVTQETKGGPAPIVSLDTNTLVSDTYNKPATVSELNIIAAQANHVFDLAEQKVPVSYVPAAG